MRGGVCAKTLLTLIVRSISSFSPTRKQIALQVPRAGLIRGRSSLLLEQLVSSRAMA